MTDYPDYLVNELTAIQRKHKQLFKEIERDIFSCVYVRWDEPVTLYIITTLLPTHIENEILAIRFDM
ncbi:MAG: hypothetical protein ACXVJG_12615 [Mucilaginibacter sp.]